VLAPLGITRNPRRPLCPETTAITSLPELVTLIAAVRIGASPLGIGDVLGGNAFDAPMIFLARRPLPIWVDLLRG
jgi:hypothetical protein